MKDLNLVRKEMLGLSDVLPLVIMPSAMPSAAAAGLEGEVNAVAKPKEMLKEIKGDLINMAAPKLQNFVENGIKCHRCKIEAEYFGKEKYPSIPFYHLNLYAMRNGREIQMLKELVVPSEKGGVDCLENNRTICFDCHKKKVSSPADHDARRKNRAKKRSENKAKKAAGEVKVKVGEKKPRRI